MAAASPTRLQRPAIPSVSSTLQQLLAERALLRGPRPFRHDESPLAPRGGEVALSGSLSGDSFTSSASSSSPTSAVSAFTTSSSSGQGMSTSTSRASELSSECGSIGGSSSEGGSTLETACYRPVIVEAVRRPVAPLNEIELAIRRWPSGPTRVARPTVETSPLAATTPTGDSLPLESPASVASTMSPIMSDPLVSRSRVSPSAPSPRPTPRPWDGSSLIDQDPASESVDRSLRHDLGPKVRKIQSPPWGDEDVSRLPRTSSPASPAELKPQGFTERKLSGKKSLGRLLVPSHSVPHEQQRPNAPFARPKLVSLPSSSPRPSMQTLDPVERPPLSSSSSSSPSLASVRRSPSPASASFVSASSGTSAIFATSPTTPTIGSPRPQAPPLPSSTLLPKSRPRTANGDDGRRQRPADRPPQPNILLVEQAAKRRHFSQAPGSPGDLVRPSRTRAQTSTPDRPATPPGPRTQKPLRSKKSGFFKGLKKAVTGEPTADDDVRSIVSAPIGNVVRNGGADALPPSRLLSVASPRPAAHGVPSFVVDAPRSGRSTPVLPRNSSIPPEQENKPTARLDVRPALSLRPVSMVFSAGFSPDLMADGDVPNPESVPSSATESCFSDSTRDVSLFAPPMTPPTPASTVASLHPLTPLRKRVDSCVPPPTSAPASQMMFPAGTATAATNEDAASQHAKRLLRMEIYELERRARALRVEVDGLRAEKAKLAESARHTPCPHCGCSQACESRPSVLDRTRAKGSSMPSFGRLRD